MRFFGKVKNIFIFKLYIMTEKEKAKAYDKAIEKLRSLHDDYDTVSTLIDIKEELECIFPELRESKDEKIRKAIIDFFSEPGRKEYILNGFTVDDIIAWLKKQGNLMKALQTSNAEIGELIEENYYLKEQLEKQGEQEPVPDWMPKFLDELRSKKHYFDWDEHRDIEGCILAIIKWMNPNYFNGKDNEQKPIIEMKSAEESLGISSEEYNDIVNECLYGESESFKVGDWITNGDYTWKIIEVKPLDYILQSQDGNIVDDTISHVDEQFHSFTIKDAKDGDVLATDKSVFIYAKTLYNKPYAYCGVDKYGVFKDNCLKNNWANSVNNILPANKEQRDTLMKAMADAGYTFDFEKKELKKVEPKYEDETTSAIKNEEAYKIGFIDGEAHAKEEMKSSWSEEDETSLGDALWAIKQARTIAKDENDMGNLWYAENWLNSIKNRIHPQIQPKQEWTEEDISNMQYIDSVLFYDKDLPEETCMRLRNWLQSLKPNKDMVEALRTEYEKGKADGIAEMKKHIDIMDKDNIDDFAYQCAYDLSKDWLYENASWDDVQIACKLGAKWYEDHHKVQWSEEDEKTLNEIFSVAARASLRKSTLFGKSYDYIKWQNWLKSLKDRVQPQQKWSEYDERMIDNIIFELEENQENISGVGYKIDWLKQLKQRYTWKPSDEQIEAFEHLIRSYGESGILSPYDNNTKLLYSLLYYLKN